MCSWLAAQLQLAPGAIALHPHTEVPPQHRTPCLELVQSVISQVSKVSATGCRVQPCMHNPPHLHSTRLHLQLASCCRCALQAAAAAPHAALSSLTSPAGSSAPLHLLSLLSPPQLLARHQAPCPAITSAPLHLLKLLSLPPPPPPQVLARPPSDYLRMVNGEDASEDLMLRQAKALEWVRRRREPGPPAAEGGQEDLGAAGLPLPAQRSAGLVGARCVVCGVWWVVSGGWCVSAEEPCTDGCLLQVACTC